MTRRILTRQRRALAAGAALAALVSTTAVAAQQQLADRFDSLSQIVEREIAQHHIPGAVVLAGNRDGVIYRRAFGDRLTAPDREALRPDAVFDLASLTKVIATTTVVMQLSEQGRIDLDARVVSYWPEFGAHGKDLITVRQLLTHISGLRPDIDSRDSWSGQQQALSRIVSDHPIAAPGTKFVYSDINFIVLGEIARRITGESLERYAASHIFFPLGMKDTTFTPGAALRARVVPTGYAGGVSRIGIVQDPTAYRMGGVAGHAGLFSTADDLARFAEMLLGNGSRAGVRILSPQSVRLMTEPTVLPGGLRRGLGWDSASDYDSGMARAFGAASYGHTGYTGTSLWVDPDAGIYLIILTSRLYPNERGDAQPLRRDIATAVAAAYRSPPVLAGIDVLEAQGFAPLRGMSVGLLTNQTGRDLQGRRTIDVLTQAAGVRLQAIFTPEHGLNADREGKIPSGSDPSTGLPIYSLYGIDRRPSPAMLSGLDAIVVDLQDAGARFYTYPATVAYLMQEAARKKIRVVILDRPNPIAAAGIRGPVMEPEFESFTGYYAMPVQHGMTLGELALMFNAEKNIGADVSVVAMRGYRPDLWFDDTGMAWVNPSPNLRSVGEAILYPGLGLLEGTNVSVGRGTVTPFEILGAPWIDGSQLAVYLNSRAIPGVEFKAIEFTPDSDRYAHQNCGGVSIHVSDRKLLDAPLLGLEIASALQHLFPEKWAVAPMLPALGSRLSFAALRNGDNPRAIAAGWTPDLNRFEAIRTKYRLY